MLWVLVWKDGFAGIRGEEVWWENDGRHQGHGNDPRRNHKSLNEPCGDGTEGYEIDLEGFLKAKEWRA